MSDSAFASGRENDSFAGRSAQAESVAELIRSARGRIVVLSGKVASGKSEFVVTRLIPRLEGEVLYADCAAGVPPKLGDRGLLLGEALNRDAVLILDNLDRLLKTADKPRREALETVLAPKRATIVLVTADENLGEVFALGRFVPGILDHLFELQEITLAAELGRFVPAGGGAPLDYGPEVIALLEADLERLGCGRAGRALISLMDRAFRAIPEVAGGRRILPADYAEIEGIRGILADHLSDTVLNLRKAHGEKAPAAGEAILEEVVMAQGRSAPLDLTGLAERLDIREDLPPKCLEWLAGPGSLLYLTKDGRYGMTPPQLAALVREQMDQNQAACRQAVRLLAEGMNARKSLDTLLSADRFRDIHEKRTLLRVDADEAAFLAVCALHHTAEEPKGAVEYWLRRITEPRLRLATLLESLYDPAPAARHRAAGLLAAFEQPEAQSGLYRLALEDEDEWVRQRAVESLSAYRNERIREHLEQEAGKDSARFRIRAIEALRIFPDDRCAAFLRGLVNDPVSSPAVRETAVQTLFRTSSQAGVDALVDIGLNDADLEDRQRAADLLGLLPGEDLAGHALTRARDLPIDKTVLAAAESRSVLRRCLPWVAVPAIAVSGILVHGLPLWVLRKRWTAIACLAIETLAVALLLSGEDVAVGAGILLWLGNCGAAAALAGWAAHARRTDTEAPASRLHQGLAGALVIVNVLTSGLAFHGIGHALTGRIKRGFVLFGLELLGVAFLAVTLGFPALFEIAPGTSLQFLSDALLQTYLYSGFILFAGTFVWDLIAVLRRELFETRQGLQWRRRVPVLRKILSGPRGAAGILSRIGGADRREIRWANHLLRQFSADVQHLQLMEFVVQSGAGAPAGIVRCLAREKTEDVVDILCDAWASATEKQRAQFFYILQRFPTETSLRCLNEKRAQFGWRASLQCVLARWAFRFRVWPKALIVTGLAIMPVSSLLVYEAGATVFHPARTQLKELQRAMKKPLGTDAMRFTAEFLARRYPEEAAEALAQDYLRQDSEHWKFLGQSLAIIVRSDSAQARPIAFQALFSAAIGSNDEGHRQASWNLLMEVAPDINDEALISGLASRLDDPQLDESNRLRIATLLRLAGTSGSTARSRARAVLSDHISWLTGLLNQPLSEENSRMALDAIAGAADRVAVPALKEFILSSTISITPPAPTPAMTAARKAAQETSRSPAPVSDPKPAREAADLAEGQRTALRRSAVNALRAIGTLRAQDALLEIAGHPKAGRDIRKEAGRQAGLMDPLSDVRSFFDQGDYRRAGDAAEAKLSPGVRPSVRNELLYYLAESSLNLASTDPEAAESRTAAAARHLEEALKTGDDPDVRRLLSRTLDARARQLQNAHRLEEARTTAERAVALNPGLADAHGTLGGILYDLNEKDAALTRFEAAVRLSPTFTWALYMQGYILYERGGPENYKAAEAAALKAQQTDPGYPWSYRLLRDIYIRQGQDRVAVERFERFRTSYPQVGEIYSQLAYLYHERMAEKDAVAYDKAYNINAALLAMSGSLSESEAADTLNNLVECSVTTGRYAEAEQRARERLASLTLPAQRLTMILFLYASQVLRGEWNEAMASLNAAEAEQEKLEAPQSVWVYNGTLNYLATRVPQTQAVQAVRELIQAINFDDRNPDRPHPKAPASIFEVNRQALRAAGAAAAGK